jgi:hypothetical protein
VEPELPLEVPRCGFGNIVLTPALATLIHDIHLVDLEFRTALVSACARDSRNGRQQPYWMSRIMQHHIKPVAAKTGIEIKGWHTLRHSYTTVLRQNNNNPKVVQGLLRHASYSITMNVYDEAMSEEKRNAHRGVIQQLNRSAPKPAIPQVVDKVGVPNGETLHRFALRRGTLYTCCEVFLKS